ncbi:hypothetical protein [Robertkochia flava]|uniref:hypothetical protein n=1 Tax=Robertkochia flava TaxID=3447986 RepID=UPI001CCC854B|nr:hypothetical protein [Robertkochia marina]
MKGDDEKYRRYLLFGMLLISLGIVFNTTLREISHSFGIVLIGFGGLLFIKGMKMKGEQDND